MSISSFVQWIRGTFPPPPIDPFVVWIPLRHIFLSRGAILWQLRSFCAFVDYRASSTYTRGWAGRLDFYLHRAPLIELNPEYRFSFCAPFGYSSRYRMLTTAETECGSFEKSGHYVQIDSILLLAFSFIFRFSLLVGFISLCVF